MMVPQLEVLFPPDDPCLALLPADLPDLKSCYKERLAVVLYLNLPHTPPFPVNLLCDVFLCCTYCLLIIYCKAFPYVYVIV